MFSQMKGKWKCYESMFYNIGACLCNLCLSALSPLIFFNTLIRLQQGRQQDIR